MTVLMNKTPVLDKGFVAHVSTGLPAKTLEKLSQHYYQGKMAPALFSMATVTVAIKCPIFVNLYLSQNFSLQLSSVTPAGQKPKIESYIPNEADIQASDVTVSKDIKEHIKETANALEITSKGYQKDGCDSFISQVNLPISVYNEVVAHGSLSAWIKFFRKKELPSPIQAYRDAVLDIVKADFPNIDSYIKKAVLDG